MVNNKESWRDSAACRGSDTGLWYPAYGVPTGSRFDQQRVREAKAICEGCPVRQQCLNYALGEGMWFGIWGGLNAKERRALAEKTRRSKTRISARTGT